VVGPGRPGVPYRSPSRPLGDCNGSVIRVGPIARLPGQLRSSDTALKVINLPRLRKSVAATQSTVLPDGRCSLPTIPTGQHRAARPPTTRPPSERTEIPALRQASTPVFFEI
jgi:hypothetical protein